MKKLVLLLLSFALLVTLIGMPAFANEGDTSSPYDQNETIKIGVLAFLTGANVAAGDFVTKGAELAVEKINAEGGILGKQVELVYEDEIDTPQTGMTAAQKMMARDDISIVVGGLASAFSLAESDAVLQGEIPFITLAGSAAILEQGNPYMWMVRVSDSYSGTVCARAAAEQLNMKHPAILYSNDSFGQNLYDSVCATLNENYQITDIDPYTYNPTEVQYSSTLTQIVNSEADGLICLGSLGNDAAIIMKQCASMGMDMPLLGATAWGTAVAIGSAGESSYGWHFFTDWVASLDSEVSKNFVDDYTAKYGEDPDCMSVYPYDAIMLAAEAIRLAGSADPAAIQEALAKVEGFEGVLGVLTAHEDHSFANRLYICQNVEGKAEVLDTVIVD